jgi:hypothetical protein
MKHKHARVHVTTDIQSARNSMLCDISTISFNTELCQHVVHFLIAMEVLMKSQVGITTVGNYAAKSILNRPILTNHIHTRAYDCT